MFGQCETYPFAHEPAFGQLPDRPHPLYNWYLPGMQEYDTAELPYVCV